MAGQVTFPRPGSVVGGKYVLESMLDSDASGAVFRARHASTGRPFAIRWLVRSSRSGVSFPPASHEPPPVDDCYQNAVVLSPLDLGRTPHGTYIVMEWLNGETLSTRLACASAGMPLTAAAKLLLPCIRAVHELHLAHVVHGDLRPGNIFICRGVEQHPESARIFDYSIGRAAGATKHIDANGEYSRDAHFLAPEQIAGTPVDRRVDVYAFGALLYQCLTGQLPFGAAQRSDDFARWIFSQDPPALPGAPGLTPTLYRFLARAMARDVCDRFESCAELADGLEDLLRKSAQIGVSVQPARVIRSARSTLRLESDRSLPMQPTAADVAHLRATLRSASGLSTPPAPLTTLGSAQHDPALVPPPRPGVRSPGSLRATLVGASIPPQPMAAASVTNSPPTARRQSSSPRSTVTSMPIVSVQATSSKMPEGYGAAVRETVSTAPTPSVQALSPKTGSLRETVSTARTRATPAVNAPLPGRLRETVSTAPTRANPARSQLHDTVAAPTLSLKPVAPPPARIAAAAPRAQGGAWPLPLQQDRSSSRPPQPLRSTSPSPGPLRWSPANSNAAPARLHSSRAPAPLSLSTHDSTLPLELLSPRAYRAPVHRSALVGSVCLAVVGIVSTVWYFSPSAERHEAASMNMPISALPPLADRAEQHAAASAAPELAPAAVPPSVLDTTVQAPSPHLAAPAPSNAARLVDDPSTPIDESDPLIAAALAELEKKEVSDKRSTARTTEPPAADSKPDAPVTASHKRSRSPAKVAAEPAPQPTSSMRRAAPANPSPDAAYKPLPAAGKMPWEIPATRKAVASQHR